MNRQHGDKPFLMIDRNARTGHPDLQFIDNRRVALIGDLIDF